MNYLPTSDSWIQFWDHRVRTTSGLWDAQDGPQALCSQTSALPAHPDTNPTRARLASSALFPTGEAEEAHGGLAPGRAAYADLLCHFTADNVEVGQADALSFLSSVLAAWQEHAVQDTALPEKPGGLGQMEAVAHEEWDTGLDDHEDSVEALGGMGMEQGLPGAQGRLAEPLWSPRSCEAGH